MKIRQFDDEVRIGTKVVYKGKVYAVVDISRRSHEAIIGKTGMVVRCSEFEKYDGGKVKKYVERKAKAKKGRPYKPVVATFKDGGERVFRSAMEAALATGLSISQVKSVLYGRILHCKGIRFKHLVDARGLPGRKGKQSERKDEI